MIFSQKIFKRINTVALFTIVFASVMPSISHAIAAKQGLNRFVQEICSGNGQSFTIQVVTAAGKLIEIALESNQKGSSKSVISHLKHCPFCNNPGDNAALEPPQAAILLTLQNQLEQHALGLHNPFISFTTLPPPAQAPPIL